MKTVKYVAKKPAAESVSLAAGQGEGEESGSSGASGQAPAHRPHDPPPANVHPLFRRLSMPIRR